MEQTYSLLRSKTFWTIVVAAVVGAGNAVVPFMPEQYSAIAVLVLTSLASYFHLQTGRSTSGTN